MQTNDDMMKLLGWTKGGLTWNKQVVLWYYLFCDTSKCKQYKRNFFEKHWICVYHCQSDEENTHKSIFSIILRCLEWSAIAESMQSFEFISIWMRFLLIISEWTNRVYCELMESGLVLKWIGFPQPMWTNSLTTHHRIKYMRSRFDRTVCFVDITNGIYIYR